MPGTVTLEPGSLGLAEPGPVKLPIPTVLTRRVRRVYWLAAVLLVRRAVVYLSLKEVVSIGVSQRSGSPGESAVGGLLRLTSLYSILTTRRIGCWTKKDLPNGRCGSVDHASANGTSSESRETHDCLLLFGECSERGGCYYYG